MVSGELITDKLKNTVEVYGTSSFISINNGQTLIILVYWFFGVTVVMSSGLIRPDLLRLFTKQHE